MTEGLNNERTDIKEKVHMLLYTVQYIELIV